MARGRQERAGRRDGWHHEPPGALVDDDALVDHHIEEMLAAFSDLARTRENNLLNGAQSID